MRPTWKAATIVAPFAKLSGSTSVLWLVRADALHVACVNGSELTGVVAACAPLASASDAVSATPTAGTRRWDSDRNDKRISFFLSTTTKIASGLVARSLTGGATLLRRPEPCMRAARETAKPGQLAAAHHFCVQRPGAV